LTLLNQLGDLNLDQQETDVESASSANDDNRRWLQPALLNDDDDVPDFMYCQPCTPLEVQVELSRYHQDVTPQEIDALLEHFNGAGGDGDEPIHVLKTREQVRVSQRPEAYQAVQAYVDTFTDKNEVSCLGGHKERILGLDISECGNYLATAGQDSQVCIWQHNKLLAKLPHDQKYECLRVSWASAQWGAEDRHDLYNHVLASGGADGVVQLWGSADCITWTCLERLDHASLDHFEAAQEGDTPQVYALQFIDHWKALPNDDVDVLNSFLLTSSDDHVHLWEMDSPKKVRKNGDGASEKKLHLREVMSLRFDDLHREGYGVTLCQVTGAGALNLPSSQSLLGNKSNYPSNTAFGGDRNPQKLVYVFDASYCTANSLLGVALADGSLRLMNGRGVCLSILQLPGRQSHLTSFSWDSTGTRLATSVATGHLITWTVETPTGSSEKALNTTCNSVLQGGHEPNRPLFGSVYCGLNEDLLLSWGVDGRLCVWDSKTKEEEIEAPLSVILHKPDYPIYAVAHRQNRIAIGGGSEGGFVGVPVFLYILETKSDEQTGTKATTGSCADENEIIRP
jgi:WD40 repeat protein